MKRNRHLSAFRAYAVFCLCFACALQTQAMAAAPAPAGHWDAARGDENRIEDLSGSGDPAILYSVTVMKKVEDLVEHPCLYFDGNGAYAEVANAPGLNPEQITVIVWFKVEPGTVESQVPLVVKSLPSHSDPWYQYGIFLMDSPDHPQSVSFYLDIDGKARVVEASNADLYSGWMCVAAAFDGHAMRLYRNGKEAAVTEVPPGNISPVDTPVLFGAYANVPKTQPNCFCGYMSTVRIFGAALSAEAIRTQYDTERGAYPEQGGGTEDRDKSDYARRLNTVLRDGRDVWGEELITGGGATYENIKDYLRPLFFSTGFTNETLGVHNLLFGEDGGAPPYVIPFADGSRIAANVYQAPRYIEFWVGTNAQERYGSELARLEGPRLGEGWYPILQTAYTDANKLHYEQESFAGHIPGVSHLVAFVRLAVDKGDAEQSRAVVSIRSGEAERDHLKATGEWQSRDTELAQAVDVSTGSRHEIFAVWSPESPLPPDTKIDATRYEEARAACKACWDAALGRGRLFEVPEALVMDVQRNLLIQNLIMRWKYSLGAVVYHDSYFQPESNDTMSTLGMYGFMDEYRDALRTLLGLSKGEQYYSNWERGEKLSHAAHYYFLTRDKVFADETAASYASLCGELKKQIEGDPHGILRKQRHCGDIPTEAYCTFHQAVCWRGMRDMAEVWKETGHAELAGEYGTVAGNFRQALLKAVSESAKTLPDGSLFVPSMLLEKETLYAPITETRIGSYWNLCMPYAFASGLWDPAGPEMGRILEFLHNHGGILLGLVRFNYYPVPVGSWRSKGLPGYYTTGFDNVYVPNYLQMLAGQDEADRMVVTFYGKLAHGQTRGTFVSGEGETVGTRPPEVYRSCYGTPCSANNSVFLLALRLMLVRESFDNNTGAPAGLFLAHATPREWLEDGKRIVMKGAPTCFGPVSCEISSRIDAGRIDVDLEAPDRNAPSPFILRLRTPGRRTIASVTINDTAFEKFNPAREEIDLSGAKGRLHIAVRYE